MGIGGFYHITVKMKRTIRRSVAVFISAAVFFGNYCEFRCENVFAQDDETSYASSLDKGQYCVLDVDTFTLPPHLGDVRFSHKGHSARMVIHIQDAHCNYFAQTKIADIIDYLNKEYGVTTINVEGGAGAYDLSAFTAISGSEIRREVAEYFVKRGEVNGAELYAINNPRDVSLWGIEDKELYLRNLKVYRDSLLYKPEVDLYLKELRHAINNLKRHIYTPELLKIDMAYNSYKAGNMDFKAYLDFLISTAKGSGISVKKYPNLYLIGQAMEKEASVDFKRANAERGVLVDKMKQILSRNEMGELLSKTVDFKTKRISVKDFYNYLLGKARECGIKTSDYPALSGYIVYVSLFEAVDSFLVMGELDKLESELKEPLYRDQREKELNVLSRNLALLGNIFELLLTKTDFAYYKENSASFGAARFLSFIEKEAPAFGITAKVSREAVNLDRYLSDIIRFYELSFERDKAFVKNMRFASSPSGNEAAVIMTGGFHTENLSELFRSEGYSYLSIMPKFTSEENYDNPYFAILAGQTADVQQMLRSALAQTALLQVVSLLNSDPEMSDAFYAKGESDIFRTAVGVIAYLRESGYSLSDIEIKGITLNSSDLGLDVRFSERGKEDVNLTVPWGNAGRISLEDRRVQLEALRTASYSGASSGAMTEKYFVHKCMKNLEEGKTLLVVTGETSGLSDLNSRWGHVGVDTVRDAFGEKMYEILTSRRNELAGMGVEFSGHNNPYGGRWHFAFTVDEDQYSSAKFKEEIENIYLAAKNALIEDARISKDISSELDSLNVVFGVSEPISASGVMDRMSSLKEGDEERHQSLLDSYARYKGTAPEELSAEAFDEMGEVYKYAVKMLFGDSLRGIIYAENVYYSDKAPQLLSRLLREELEGGIAANNVFSKGAVPSGVERVFFSSDPAGQGTIKDWYRSEWTRGWGKYDVFRFRIPNFTQIERTLEDLGDGSLTESEASRIIAERLSLNFPDMRSFGQLTDYITGLAVLSHDGIPQGRDLINTLMRKYSEPDDGFMFRINLDFDNLSQAPVAYGDIVNSSGVNLIEEAFSRVLGTAVTVRSGSGDEMVVVGYSPLSEKDTKDMISGVVKELNEKLLPGLTSISSEGEEKTIRWTLMDGTEWSPSISAGVSFFDLGNKDDIEKQLSLLDAKSEQAITEVKNSGKRNVVFYDENLPGEDLYEENMERAIPADLVDVALKTVSAAYAERALKDPFVTPDLAAISVRAPPESLDMPESVTGSISQLMGNVRNHNYPNVHIIGLTKEEFEIERTYMQNLSNETKRYCTRQVGNSNYYQVFYNMESSDVPGDVKEAVLSLPENVRGSEEARFVASGNEGLRAKVESVLKDAEVTGMGQYVGMVEGNFSPADGYENQRYSHVSLAFYGIGLMEWDRSEGATKKAIAESLKTLLGAIVDNFDEVKNLDPEDVIRQVLSGNFIMNIKKVDFENIKAFMESERAILRSL